MEEWLNKKEDVLIETQFKRKGLPLIALRPDQDTLKKIEYLTKIYNTKSETIKRAIDMSYNGLILQGMIEKILLEIKTIFGEDTKLMSVRFGKRTTDELFEDEPKVDFSYGQGYVIFNIPCFEKKCNIRKLNPQMGLLVIEMKVESLNLMKVDIIKPLLYGPFSEIPAELLKTIHELGAKYGLHVRSNTISKKSEIQIEYHLETYMIPHEKSWKNEIKKHLQNISTAMGVLCQNNFFIETKS